MSNTINFNQADYMHLDPPRTSMIWPQGTWHIDTSLVPGIYCIRSSLNGLILTQEPLPTHDVIRLKQHEGNGIIVDNLKNPWQLWKLPLLKYPGEYGLTNVARLTPLSAPELDCSPFPRFDNADQSDVDIHWRIRSAEIQPIPPSWIPVSIHSVKYPGQCLEAHEDRVSMGDWRENTPSQIWYITQQYLEDS